MNISTISPVVSAPPNKTAVHKSSTSADKKEEINNSENISADNLLKLDTTELAKVRELKARDLEVRTHEQAHLSAAGRYANGGASFTYQRGPNGVSYATGGEVSIDTSPVSGDPKATLEKAQVIQRAALAPAQPSSQDRAVAAAAAQMAAQARAELLAAAAKSGDIEDQTEINTYEEIETYNKDQPEKILLGIA